MTNRKNILSIVILLLFITVGYGQQQISSESCKDLLHSIYKRHSNGDAIKGKALKYSYTSKIIYNDDKIPELPAITSTVIMGDHKMIFKSKMAEMYQDEEEMVVVIPATREVVRSSVSTPGVKEGMGLPQVYQVMDTIISMSKILSCTNYENKQGNGKRIQLQIPYELKRTLGFEGLTFWISEEKKIIKKIRISYPKESDIKSVTNSFYGFDTHYKMKYKSVLSNVFDKNGKLLPKYSEYTVIDQR